MKLNRCLLAIVVVALSASSAHALQFTPGQGLLPAGAVTLAADPAAASSPDDGAYADGVRAINAAQWSDAIAIFSRVAAQGDAHAEGALYWKAYAENKQGQTATALDTCGGLRHDHPASSWIEECGALEIEIRARNGNPVAPKTEQSDDLKLLALASLMKHDEKKALAQIDQILNSDASEKLKQGAVFIMGEHHSDAIYPQIARISFVDGDVRIERGQQDSHHKDVTWEAAISGVPVESGHSIVTGDGRAEIEFEDASTLYLAPNSVLTVNDLSTLAGVPHTDLALLSGTVTLHVHPYVSGETFLLRTPTDNLFVKYPNSSNLRMTSYLDGIAIGSLDKSTLSMGVSNASQLPLPAGQTLYFKEGRRILDAGPTHPEDFSGWDQWVSNRYTARTAALTEVAKEAGLSSPVPGMADMKGQGHFFACQPYGTCWEPNPARTSPEANPSSTQAAASPQQPAAGASLVAQTSSPTAKPAARNIQFIGPPAASGPPPGYSEMDSFLPCVPYALQSAYIRAVLPASASVYQQFAPAWAWTVCHSGSWIYQDNRYLWVAGQRDHESPIHWVKYGHNVAFVPVHPRDVKDHLPVNRSAPAFVVNVKNGSQLQRATFGSSNPVQLMKEPPKEFRSVAPMPLPHVADPHMEGHELHNTFVARGSGPGSAPGQMHRPAGVPITFDHHSQNFMMPNHAMEGGNARIGSGFAPISNRGGDLQSHAGAFNGNGGFHGGYSGANGGGAAFHGGGGANVSSGASMHSSGASAPSVSASAPSAASSGGAHK
jgi:hypothetical protein